MTDTATTATAETATTTEASTASTETSTQSTEAKAKPNMVTQVPSTGEAKTEADMQAELADSKLSVDADTGLETEAKEATSKESKNAQSKTSKELGYPDADGVAKTAIDFAVELGIDYSTIKEAIVDGELDVSKLGKDLDASSSARLKAIADAALSTIKAKKAALTKELHDYAGGEDTFTSVIEWANKRIKGGDTAFKTEATQYQKMMQAGGVQAKLAVQALVQGHRSDAGTSYNPKGNNNTAKQQSTLTKAQQSELERNRGWEAFRNKYQTK